MTRDLLNFILAMAIASSVGYLAWQVGLHRGRTEGFAKCISQQDDDRTIYAGGEHVPNL